LRPVLFHPSPRFLFVDVSARFVPFRRPQLEATVRTRSPRLSPFFPPLNHFPFLISFLVFLVGGVFFFFRGKVPFSLTAVGILLKMTPRQGCSVTTALTIPPLPFLRYFPSRFHGRLSLALIRPLTKWFPCEILAFLTIGARVPSLPTLPFFRNTSLSPGLGSLFQAFS